jgi:hypothetical protein
MGLPSFILPIMGKGGYLPLTKAWIAATGETDTTILNALNTFEAGLIANSLTGKFNALYPFVGGTSTKHSYNFINTSLYNLSFNGGWTHSANGALPNGTNGYANTGIIPNSLLSLNSAHLSYYSRNNTNAGSDIGCLQTVPTRICRMEVRDVGLFRIGVNDASVITSANASSLGYYLGTRTASTARAIYKNGALANSDIVVSTTLPTIEIFLGAGNVNGVANGYTNRQCALASIGSGLTSGEISTLYTLIQAFQTSLSRAV